MKLFKPASLLESAQDKILKATGFEGAQTLGSGAEGTAYKKGSSVLKISKHQGFDDSFIEADKQALKGNFRHIAKPLKLGKMDDVQYSIKEYYKPLPKKLIDDIKREVHMVLENDSTNTDELWDMYMNREKFPPSKLTTLLFPVFKDIDAISRKAGVDPDIGISNCGLDKSGKIVVFDV